MQNVLFKAVCATLDELSAGIVVMFTDGRVLHANSAAREMMADGWPVRACHGYIQGKDRNTTEALLRTVRLVVQAAAAGNPEGVSHDVCLARASYQRGAVIGWLKPFMLSGPGNSTHAIVALFITHLGKRVPCSLTGIGESFGLTPAETRTLERLVEGGTVSEVATALRISENTVKTHLQNIFSKTETSGQKDLLQLVNELRAPLRPSMNSRTLKSPSYGVPSLTITSYTPAVPQPSV